MSWFLGAGLGFLRGGPLGALIGGAAQHFLTKNFQKEIRRNLSAVKDEGGFVVCLVSALTHICMGRDDITLCQTRVIHKFFARNLNYDGHGFKYIQEIINESKRINPDLAYLAENYKKSTDGNYVLLLLALAYQVALVEGALDLDVQSRINSLAEELAVDPEEHNRIRAKYCLEALRTPYTVLEVLPTATNAEIKKSYRLKASEFHPDRVAHLGQERVEEAHLRFLEVQTAYRELEKIRGL
tara:strand:- start:1949 stop:2671 length:723 start_codon:yes stop_codon:yes gene_type:complete